ncbi:MAG: phosphoribosylformimino-5-aminoimidazole carboxamide ribotide isomerase [Euryarchaeota archaeon]|nr:phosphoribosylformimino-5-aminoimidazole carboxamide ribotide isomerase [Euryarchaeota archaeon]
MRCVFVLDILNGAVVHALRGERSRYEPISSFSRIVSDSEPLSVIQAIHPKEVYIADLNLLTCRGDNLSVINEISRSTKTLADTGISSVKDLDLLSELVIPVLGTETASLSLIEAAAGKGRQIVVSIDMRMRRVLSSDSCLAGQTPIELLERLNHLDLKEVILLELDRVGTSSGLDIAFLEEAQRVSENPLMLGGGVKDERDLALLEKIGFSGALVATAVHNGRIPVTAVQ